MVYHCAFMAQLLRLVVTVWPARYTYYSIGGWVHNHHYYCYCYWYSSLSPVLYYCYRGFANVFLHDVCFGCEHLRNNFWSYYLNSMYIIKYNYIYLYLHVVFSNCFQNCLYEACMRRFGVFFLTGFDHYLFLCLYLFLYFR